MKRTLLLIAAALGSLSLHAGTVATDFKKSIIEPEPEKQIALNIVTAQAAYVGDSGFRRGAGKFGDQSASQVFVLGAHRFQLADRWYFKLGVVYERFDFGSSSAPVPSHLQSAAAVIALEYVVDGDVGFFIESHPGVYFSDSIDGDAISAPTNIAFAYPVRDKTLYLIGGVSYSPFREYQLLPLAGILWRINPQWTLRGYLPEPRLIYQPSERLKLWVGGEYAGGSFRTDDRNVSPDKLSGALVSYSEYRAGAGVTYSVCSGFTIDAGAGYVLSREFDYHRAGERYGLEGAPYLKLAGTAEF